MITYLNMLRDVLENGELRDNRTGIKAYSLFGRQYTYDLSKGFPLITTKKIHIKSVVDELLWADNFGNLGLIYGNQWRNWGEENEYDNSMGYYRAGVDQISNLITSLKNNKFSRRHIVSAWNVSDLEDMALQPCHILFQCYVSNDNKLSLQFYQRSADAFLGVPFNIASYALLVHILAQHCGYQIGNLIHSIGDLHLYENHVEQAKLQLTREPFDLCELKINTQRDAVWNHEFKDFKFINYKCHPAIKADVAV